MLPDPLRTELKASIAAFLWRQWSQLGVAGEPDFRDRWLIDPEALLLFTLGAGRYDPRLFDEVVDWCLRNRRWLSIQRLKNLADQQSADDVGRILAAFSAFISEHDSRWGRLAGTLGADMGDAVSLFLDPATGIPLPLLGPPEPSFARHGVMRPPLRARGMSRQVPTDVPTSLIFKLRGLFGLGTRAEVVAYLLTHQSGYPSEVARLITYAAPSVQEVMADLAQSGLVLLGQSGREKLYSIDRERWRPFLRLKGPLPFWVDWPRAFAGILQASAFLTGEPLDQMSDYIVRSRLIDQIGILRSALENSGLPLKFGVRPNLDTAPRLFTYIVKQIISVLGKRTPAPTARVGGSPSPRFVQGP